MVQNKYDVKISPAALTSMEETIRYISVTLSNPSAADRLLDDFYDAIERAALFPYAMAAVTNKNVTEKEYRKILIRNFISIYSINEDEHQIQIMAFRYAPSSLGDNV